MSVQPTDLKKFERLVSDVDKLDRQRHKEDIMYDVLFNKDNINNHINDIETLLKKSYDKDEKDFSEDDKKRMQRWETFFNCVNLEMFEKQPKEKETKMMFSLRHKDDIESIKNTNEMSYKHAMFFLTLYLEPGLIRWMLTQPIINEDAFRYFCNELLPEECEKMLAGISIERFVYDCRPLYFSSGGTYRHLPM